jgi:hypothetical protein
VATRKALRLDSKLLEHVSTATNTTEEAMHCRVTSIPRQHIQKHFLSHSNEPPKQCNSEERNNSTVEGCDPHAVRPEPTSGRELTNRTQNMTEDKRQTGVRSEVFSLCGVIIVYSYEVL